MRAQQVRNVSPNNRRQDNNRFHTWASCRNLHNETVNYSTEDFCGDCNAALEKSDKAKTEQNLEIIRKAIKAPKSRSWFQKPPSISDFRENLMKTKVEREKKELWKLNLGVKDCWRCHQVLEENGPRWWVCRGTGNEASRYGEIRFSPCDGDVECRSDWHPAWSEGPPTRGAVLC
jgi:hypothetical protein